MHACRGARVIWLWGNPNGENMTLCLSTVLVSDIALQSKTYCQTTKVAFKCKNAQTKNCIKYVNKEWGNYAEGFLFSPLEKSNK